MNRLVVIGMALLWIGSASGCSKGASSAVPASPLTLQPATLELGEVQASQGTADFSFTLTNHSPDAVRVDIQPGCGCTTIDQSTVEIAAGATHSCRATVSLQGRRGDFHSSIRVESRAVTANPQTWANDLPLHAVIADHWRASPQRIILESAGAGTVAVSAPAAEWSGVDIQLIGPDLEFRQASAVTESLIETRTFRVTAKLTETWGGNRGLGFRRGNQTSAFFTVPVLIR